MSSTGRTTLWTHGSAIQYRWWDNDSATNKGIHVQPSLDGTTVFAATGASDGGGTVQLFLPLPTATFIGDSQFKLWHLYFYYTTVGNGKISKLDMKQRSGTTIAGSPFPVTNLPQGTQFSSGIQQGITFFDFDNSGNPPWVGDNSKQAGYCLELDITLSSMADRVIIHGVGVEYIHQKWLLA
ncbi:hypothetical protein [Bacillus sp. NH11B]|uniref:hypothetical protein n=1 Tax=Bacillus sp. NH11B TaxID=1866314 RepID=UPI0008FDBAF1|nr:hypothetical protein [Bacillus sp. NH11B]OJD58616.1 hypothetical protein BAU27_17270 [Bacillus sp. NH11B]